MNEGMTLLKKLCKPDYLKLPAQSLEVFEQHPSQPPFWGKSMQPGLWKYDRNADYLAAMGSVQLGVGEYVQYEQDMAERLETSQWSPGLVHLDVSAEGECPFFLGVGPSWVYTPLVTFARQTAVLFTVREAYIWPESKRVLYPFYDELRKRKNQGEDVKPLYTSVSGMLAHKPLTIWRGCVYRPDWHALIIAQAKMLNYLHAWEVWQGEGLWPQAMKTDALYYPQQVHTLKVGPGIGQYKESRT